MIATFSQQIRKHMFTNVWVAIIIAMFIAYASNTPLWQNILFSVYYTFGIFTFVILALEFFKKWFERLNKTPKILAIGAVTSVSSLLAFFLLVWFLTFALESKTGIDFVTIPEFWKLAISIVAIANTMVFTQLDYNRLQKPAPKRLDSVFLPVNRVKERIAFCDIYYLRSSGRNTILHLYDYEKKVSLQLNELNDLLPHKQFIRVHKQYVVNLSHIEKVQYHTGGNYLLHLKNGDEDVIPLSRTKAVEVKEKLGLNSK